MADKRSADEAVGSDGPASKIRKVDGGSTLESAVDSYVERAWNDSCLPTLKTYITIPNVSPCYDNEWATNGFQDQAFDLLSAWVTEQNVTGLEMEVLKEEGRTSLIFCTVAPTTETDNTVLMYGHADKQPPFTGWEEGLGPYTPVVRDGKLYGRGGADDGYSVFAAITAIKALQEAGAPHGRIVIVIEGSEESGSPDLPFYINHLKDRIGTPSLIICLDSGCGNYEQAWLTTTLRGLVAGNLRVDILSEGVHSGHASGIVPDSFRLLRNIISRIEDPVTGTIVDDFQVEIPQNHVEMAAACAAALGNEVIEEMPFVEGAGPVEAPSIAETILNRTWRAQLSVTGAEGLPTLEKAGNVLRPYTAVKLSLRLPPTMDAKDAAARLTEILEADAPYGCTVSFTTDKAGSGWAAPDLAPWLSEAFNGASQAFYGKDMCFIGEGGSIPFMGMLGEMYPEAQFVVTGVLGPHSNPHGPNEMLHLDFTSKLIRVIALVLNAHHAQGSA